MLADVREKWGVGSPPKDENQNANEVFNSLIKRPGPKVQESDHSIKQFSWCKRKSEVKEKTSGLLFLEKVKSVLLDVFGMLGLVAGGQGCVGPFLSNPTNLRKRSNFKAVQSILRKRFS